MKQRTHLLLLLLALWNPFFLLAQPRAAGAMPSLLAVGSINTENPEFGGTISPDGHTFWFNRTSPDRSKMTLMESRWENGQWSKSVIPAFADTIHRNIDPVIQPDGKQLLFTSNRPLPGKKTGDYNLWLVRSGSEIPEPFPPAINTDEDEIYGSMDQADDLYFARFQGAKAKIYVSKWINNAYQPAEQLTIPGTDTASMSNPAISPNGQWLVFASRQLGGAGAADLFIAQKRADGGWSEPKNLGTPVNSADADFAPSFSADGKTLFFTSERPGVVQDFPAGNRRPGDIYAVAFEGKTYPSIKIAREPDHIARLEAINRDIWIPFAEAYATGDVEKYMSLHTADFIRASTEDTKDLNTYRADSNRHFDYNKANNRRCEIAFTFFERVAGPLTASERGIYRYTAISGDGSRQHSYGKFHVFHRYVGGRWKITVDYDSDEDNSIHEGDFNAGLAPDIFFKR